MAKLDSLVVDLQLNSAALRSGLESAKGALETFGESVKGIDEKLHSLSEAKAFEIGKELVKGLAEFVQKGAEAAEKMGLLAQAAGVPVEAFSKLDYAASLSGVSTEDLGKAFSKLDKNLAEAGAGGKAQVALFSALGVSVKDASGQVRSSGDVMNDLATKFAGLKDGASKTALAMELFGKSGAGMVPFLNEGGEGLKKLGDEADRFGVTISTGAAEAAREFEDNLKKLERATQAVGVRVAAELAPAMNNLTKQLLGSKEGADALKGASEVLASILKTLVSAGVIVGAVFDAVGKSIGRAASAIIDAARGDFDAVLSLNANFAGEIVSSGATAVDRLQAIWGAGTGAEDALKKQDEAGKKSADSMMKSLEAMKKAAAEYETAMKSLTKVALEYESKVAGFGAGPLGQLEGKLNKGELADQLKKIGGAADAMRDRILSAATALHDLEQAKLSAKVDFDIGRTKTSTDETVRQRTTDFTNIGKSHEDIRSGAEAGFASFDAALKEFAKQTDINARRIGEAELLRAEGDEEGAQRALLFADKAKLAADKASKAADAFADGARETQSAMQKFANIAESVVAKVVNKMGQAGEVINAGIEGFKSGGIWGAIIGVIVDILTKLSGFIKMMDSINSYFGRWIENVSKATAPLFDGIIQFAENLGTLIEEVTSVTGAFETIGVVMRAIALVIDTVELSLLYGTKATLAFFGAHNDKLDAMITKVENDVKQGFDAKPAKALNDGLSNLNTAVQKTTDKFGEMLTNLPSGYKIKGAQFRADGGGGGGSSSDKRDWSAKGLSDAIGNTTDQQSLDQWSTSLGGPIFGSGGTEVGQNYSSADGMFGNWDLHGQDVSFGSQGAADAGLGGTNSATGVGGGVASITKDEAATYIRMYNEGIAAGMSPQAAANAAQAYLDSHHSGGGDGGGAGAAGSGGGTGGLVIQGDLIVHAKDIHEFAKQITEIQSNQLGRRVRNPRTGK